MLKGAGIWLLIPIRTRTVKNGYLVVHARGTVPGSTFSFPRGLYLLHTYFMSSATADRWPGGQDWRLAPLAKVET